MRETAAVDTCVLLKVLSTDSLAHKFPKLQQRDKNSRSTRNIQERMKLFGFRGRAGGDGLSGTEMMTVIIDSLLNSSLTQMQADIKSGHPSNWLIMLAPVISLRSCPTQPVH